MANSYLKLQVKSSGQYLNILNGGGVNGQKACQGVLATTDNFMWEIMDAPNNPGWSLLQVKSSGQYLNILNGGNTNGQVACQGNTPTTDNFFWRFVDAPNNPGWYLLQVKSSGQYLNISNGGNTNGQVACQGNTPTTDNFFWQKDNATHHITVSATVSDPFPPSLSDDEGHLANTATGDDDMTTKVAPGDTVIWQKGENISSLDNIFESAGNDLFSIDPKQQPDGTWLGIIGSLPPCTEESYSITYKVGGNSYTQDPKLIMR
jgi:hypothetical protein